MRNRTREEDVTPAEATVNTGSSRNSTWRLTTASLTPRWGAGARGPGPGLHSAVPVTTAVGPSCMNRGGQGGTASMGPGFESTRARSPPCPQRGHAPGVCSLSGHWARTAPVCTSTSPSVKCSEEFLLTGILWESSAQKPCFGGGNSVMILLLDEKVEIQE